MTQSFKTGFLAYNINCNTNYIHKKLKNVSGFSKTTECFIQERMAVCRDFYVREFSGEKFEYTFLIKVRF